MTAVEIYCRVATAPSEDSNHLEEQERICREYCNAQGLTVSEVRHEVYSGLELYGRPALKNMRENYLNGNIQGIVVTTLNRLSRSNVHLAILVNEMETHHISLYVVQESLEDSLQGRWLLAISSLMTAIDLEKAIEL